MRLPLALCLGFLICHTAHSQGRVPVAPLRPLIVQLDSGTTLRHYYVGLDSTEYTRQRKEKEATRRELENLRAMRALDNNQVAGLRQDVLACRAVSDGYRRNYDELKKVTDKAIAQPGPPLLLDGHFYLGMGAGAAALAILQLLLHF